jgi:hypothetical protein
MSSAQNINGNKRKELLCNFIYMIRYVIFADSMLLQLTWEEALAPIRSKMKEASEPNFRRDQNRLLSLLGCGS